MMRTNASSDPKRVQEDMLSYPAVSSHSLRN
uniref:Uncharacterized protein n=1 Tax=Arundo donax TaxID=35708 RepID=A0A0A9ECV6_ARUDO